MPLTALGLYLVLGCCWVGNFLRPIYGIMGYLIIYSIYNPDAWWVRVTNGFLPRPSFIAMVFVVLGALINFNKLNWNISRKEWLFYLFLVLCWISTFVFGTTTEADTWEYVMKMTKLFVFIFFFLRIVNSLSDYKKVIWTIIGCAIWISYQAHLMAGAGRLDRLGGIDFGEANGLSAYMAIAVIFLAFQMLRHPLWFQLIFICALALMLDTIILTESRSIFLGLFFAVPYVFLHAPRGQFKKLIVYCLFGMILFLMLMDTSFLERISTIGDVSQNIEFERSLINEKAAVDRIDFWRASIDIFKDHPFGIGVKNFYKIVPLYDPLNPGMDAHNTYVLCYSEIGILGIIVFLWILFETYFQIRKIDALSMNSIHVDEIQHHLVSIGSVLVALCAGYMMTHSNLYVESFWIMLALPICLENAVRAIEKE